jgi:ketosteroid isomerase-like protein
MSQENVEVVREMFAAAARAISGEPLEDLYRLLDPDVEWIPINAPLEGTSYRGHRGVRRWIEEMDLLWDDFEALPSEFVDIGNDRLLAFGTWRARGRTSGVQLDAQPAAWLIRLRNGKAVRMQTFTDRAAALEAAGLRE